MLYRSVSPEQIPRIDLALHVVQAAVITVGDDCLTLFLKVLQIIDHFASKERRPILQRWFVDDYRRPFGFDSLHDTLDAALPEVVTVGFHRQPVHADDDLLLLR